MAVKMNLRMITKNNAAYPERGFFTKSIPKPNGYATAMPTAWKLIPVNYLTHMLYFLRWRMVSVKTI